MDQIQQLHRRNPSSTRQHQQHRPTQAVTNNTNDKEGNLTTHEDSQRSAIRSLCVCNCYRQANLSNHRREREFCIRRGLNQCQQGMP